MLLKTRKLLSPLAAAVSLFVAPIAQAADVNLFTAALPPFANGVEAENKGLVVELVEEMSTRAGLEMSLSYEPWARAVKTAQTSENGFLAPPFRTPEREALYGWVTELLPAKQLFVTQGEAIGSLDDARGLGKIVVLRGSIMEKGLTDAGFTNLHSVTSSVQAVKLVATGRADAWYAVDIETFGAIKEAGYARADFAMGDAIVERVHWLASTPTLDPAVGAALGKAMAEMRADGSYDAIVGKYLN